MSNSKAWAAPTIGYYNRIKSPQFEIVAWIVCVSCVVLGIATAISASVIPLIPLLPILVSCAYVVTTTIKHEAYSLNRRQFDVYQSYHNLPEDIRSKVSLTTDSIKKISEDPASWDKLKKQLETLHNVWNKRKQEEARLDAGAQILFEDIHRAITEEQQTRDAIKQVLGDKPERVNSPEVMVHERKIQRIKAAYRDRKGYWQ